MQCKCIGNILIRQFCFLPLSGQPKDISTDEAAGQDEGELSSQKHGKDKQKKLKKKGMGFLSACSFCAQVDNTKSFYTKKKIKRKNL